MSPTVFQQKVGIVLFSQFLIAPKYIFTTITGLIPWRAQDCYNLHSWLFPFQYSSVRTLLSVWFQKRLSFESSQTKYLPVKKVQFYSDCVTKTWVYDRDLNTDWRKSAEGWEGGGGGGGVGGGVGLGGGDGVGGSEWRMWTRTGRLEQIIELDSHVRSYIFEKCIVFMHLCI